MHGRPRKPLKPEDSAASIAKANKLRTLQSQFYHIHHNKMYVLPSLSLFFSVYARVLKLGFFFWGGGLDFQL